MNRTLKRFLYSIIAIGAVFIIAIISINIILKNKVENFIEQRLPDNMIPTYDDLSVETLSGSLLISNASLIIKNKQDSLKHTFINVEKLSISSISYWEYLVNNEIHIESLILDNPSIAYYKDRIERNAEAKNKGILKMHKPIIIENIRINNSKLGLYEDQEDSTKLYTNGFTLKIEGVRIDDKTISKKIPFDYKDYSATSDSVFVKASPYENLTVKDFSLNKEKAVFNGISLKTKYSKKELSRLIKKEKDHYDLSLSSLSLQAMDFGFNKDGFFAKSEAIILDSPSLQIYRNKLVADETKIKPLYSKMLRELPFQLTVDSLYIENAYIRYEERVKTENMGGYIDFENLNATMANVSNTYKSPEKTTIKITAKFMEQAPISVDWSFDVQNEQEEFIFKGEIGALDVSKLNKLTQPNSNLKLDGHTNKTYFTIDGNNDTSQTDLKINYTDFKVTLLKKDGEQKNKFLSTVANIFISKDSEKKGEKFKEGSAVTSRSKTKSIFNFLWNSIKNALMNAML